VDFCADYDAALPHSQLIFPGEDEATKRQKFIQTKTDELAT